MKQIEIATQLEHIDRHIAIQIMQKEHKEDEIKKIQADKEKRIQNISDIISTKEGIMTTTKQIERIRDLIGSALLEDKQFGRYSKRLEIIQEELDKRLHLL